MKILIDSYDTCCQNNSGGVQIRLKKTYELLKNKKIDTKLFNKFDDKIDDYDILHIFKLEYQKYSLIDCAKLKGKKVIISTIMSTNINWKIRLHRLIAKFKFTSIYKINENLLNQADALICETPKEKEFLNKFYKINSDKIFVIPNGTEIIKYEGNDIYDIIGRNKKYILQVGVFNENKNQLNVIKALKNTDIELIFIGGAYFKSQKYYEKCLKEAKGCQNIHFLGWVEHDSNLFKSAYSHADAVILPSYSETFGLVAIEAIMYGAKLVLSNSLSILSYEDFKEFHTFSPNNTEEIKNAVIKTINSKKNQKTYDKIIKDFSWDTIIEEHIKLYRSLLNEKNNNNDKR